MYLRRSHRFVKFHLDAAVRFAKIPVSLSMPRTTRPATSRRARLHTAATLPSASTEDYLERINELFESKGYARVVDIATNLQVSQPSVTAMVQRMADAGYLKYEKYRGILLTEKGRLVARRIK